MPCTTNDRDICSLSWCKTSFWEKVEKYASIFSYLMRMFKGFPIIKESFMTWSEDWQIVFRYWTLPGKRCMCQNSLQIEYEPLQNLHSHLLLPEFKSQAPFPGALKSYVLPVRWLAIIQQKLQFKFLVNLVILKRIWNN